MAISDRSKKWRQWVGKNPQKRFVHRVITAAIASGELVEPDPPACESCGKVTRLVAHHEDYDLPLAVDWICQHCHYWLHHGVVPAPPRKRPAPLPRPRRHKAQQERRRRKLARGVQIRKGGSPVAPPFHRYHMCEAMPPWPGKGSITNYPCKMASEWQKVFCKKHRNWQGDVKEK